MDIESVLEEGDAESTWRIVIDSPGLEKCQAELNLATLPTEPIQLVLGSEVGTIALTAVGMDGNPLPHEVTFELGFRVRPDQCDRTVQPGETAVFEAVPVGTSYHIHAKTAPGLAVAFVKTPKLSQANELAEVEVQFGPVGPTIFGVLKQPNGSPISTSNRLIATMEVGDGVEHGKLTVASDGTMQATFTGMFAAGAPCRFEITGSTDLHDSELFGARIDATVPAWGVPLDVGVVDLESNTRRLRGRVVDRVGLPVPEIYVDLVRRAAPPRDSWEGLGILVLTDSEGRFTLDVPKEPGSMYALKAGRPAHDFDSEFVVIDAVTKEVTVVGDRIVELHGRIILPDDWLVDSSANGLQVNWARPGEDNSHFWSRSFSLDQNGNYRIPEVAAGEVDLVLRRSYKSDEILRWKGITVPGDQPIVRLDDWNVQGEFQRLSFEVRLPDGMDGHVVVSTNGKRWIEKDRVFDQLVLKADSPLYVECYGCKSYMGSTDAVGDVVVLEPGYEITLDIEVPKEPHSLSKGQLWFFIRELHRDGPGATSSDEYRIGRHLSVLVPLDDEGRATTPMGEAGEYYVEFWHGEGPSRVQVDPSALPPHLQNVLLTVEEGPRQQVHAIGKH